MLMWCEATGEVRQFASVFCREVYEWLRESQIVLKEKNRIARAWDTGESYDDLTQQGGTEWKIGHRQ